MATIAPDGTSWAREFRALVRDVEERTHGHITLKIYFGGIAGDELEVGDRIQHGQLDGSFSGGALCQQLSPSMRVASVLGLFQSREEATHVMTGLNGIFTDEFHRAGFTNLGTAGVGSVILFSNTPVRSLDDIRHLRIARWHLDQVGLLMDKTIGIHSMPLPPAELNRSLENHAVDGAVTTPTVTLAWQMIGHLRYFLDLRMNYFYGCTIMSSRSFDRLAIEDQAEIRTAVAKFRVRMEEAGRQQDDTLLGGLFQQKGLQPLAVTSQLRGEFLAAARQAREHLGERLGVPAPTLQRVLQLLADYRAEHPQ
jgi:TRAP-type C4-dicarboxylate transport system substrate-binding protein